MTSSPDDRTLRSHAELGHLGVAERVVLPADVLDESF